MPTEKQTETAIIHFIRAAGGWCEKIHSGAMLKTHRLASGALKTYKMKLATAGTPDIIACIKGHFIGIEIKKDQKEIEKWKRQKDTDRRSIDQHRQQELIRNADGYTIVVASVEEVEADLKELGLL